MCRSSSACRVEERLLECRGKGTAKLKVEVGGNGKSADGPRVEDALQEKSKIVSAGLVQEQKVLTL